VLRPQLWAMFDRDTQPQIREAFAQAEREDVQIAFSHPSFDLWLLLHFSDFQGSQGGSSKIVVGKLRGADAAFARYATRSGEKKLDGRRINALRGKHGHAAKRAQRLSDDCLTGACSRGAGHCDHCQPTDRDPSTDVWRLLDALGIL
jgi:RloB-like protein